MSAAPATRPTAAPTTTGSTTTGSTTTGSTATARALRILLLEDSVTDEKILAARLRLGGLTGEVRRVEAREPFLTALLQWRPDVVLSDFNVPGFGGQEALVLVQEHQPHIPFLFVSGALGEHAAVELLKRGATDYVLKDRLERLVPSIERALREAHEKSEHQQAQLLLQERERTLSTLLHNLPGMAFRARLGQPSWHLDFASEGCLALTGYEPDAFRPDGGLDFGSIMHPDDVARVAAESADAFQRGAQLATTYRIRHCNGEQRWVWVRAVSHPGEEGMPAMMEGFASDITAQKVAEAEVLRRVEFEQQLIGIVSHDLKNPLNAILLGASALLKREGTNEVVTRLTRRIVASTERATRMINDLLDFTEARLGSGLPVNPERVDLRDLVTQVLDEFEQSHPDRKVTLTAPTTMEATVDPGRLTQVVTNLVQNALTYSPLDSEVVVRVNDVNDVNDANDANDGHVVLEVHNRGAPIPPEKMKDIFQPLKRGGVGARSNTRSIGLGLFIVESIVRAHDGTITVQSTPDEGTTFVVRLPRTGRKIP